MKQWYWQGHGGPKLTWPLRWLFVWSARWLRRVRVLCAHFTYSKTTRCCGSCWKEMGVQIVVMKAPLSAAVGGKKGKNKHMFKDGRMVLAGLEWGLKEFPCQSLICVFTFESVQLCTLMFWLHVSRVALDKNKLPGKTVCHRPKFPLWTLFPPCV